MTNKTYLNDGELVYFASNFRFKTVAESWLVTMTMVAEMVAPKAMSLSAKVGMHLAMAILE